MKLSDTKIRNTKPSAKPIKLPDGKGLYLEVRPSGSRLWRYRYKIAGKENLYALGEYFLDKRPGHVSLDDARTKRAEARELVKQGIHPAHRRSGERTTRIAESANTFETIAREWLAIQAKKWTPVRTEQARLWIERDLFPTIGNLPIREVRAAHLLDVMRKVAAGEGKGDKPAPTVAIQLRQYASRVFQYAVATLRAESDPTTALRGAVEKPKTVHRRPLDRKRIPDLLQGLDDYNGDPATAIALRLLLLVFVRQGELRAAEWSEFDLDHALWTVPAGRMKMRTAHLVPLSTQAVELLRRLHAITGRRQYLFPNHKRPKSYMGNTTLNAALVRIGFASEVTPHGFRATASTMLNEIGYRADVIERQLAHEERNAVRNSYNRAQYLPERQEMMQHWADMLDALAQGAKVIPLQRKLR
jgi:integrase